MLSSAFASVFLPLVLLLVLSKSAIAADASTITVAAALPTNAPSYVDNSDFRSAVLNSTNFFRKQHGASPLKWNDSLADFGADHTENCKFKHSGGPTGENLAEGYANVTASIDAWGNERDEYDFSDQGFSEETGHFTQLVWKATTAVGCGRKFCEDDFTGWYLTCEYYPQGNVIGQFDQNVEKQTTDDGKNDSGDNAGGGNGTVNDNGDDDCPQGAVCNAATITQPNLANLALLVALLAVLIA